jgi:hypothetical protein
VSLFIGVPATEADTAAARSVTIRVLVTPVTRAFKDVAPKTHGKTGRYTKGDAVSGTSILRNAVRQLDKPKGARVGTNHYVITAQSEGTFRGDIVAELPGGTVHARGAMTKIAGNPRIAIVGGTGVYAGATGEVEGQVLLGGKQLNIYRLRLP